MNKSLTSRILVVCLILFSFLTLNAQQGVLIHNDNTQNKILSAYRFVLEQSDNDYRTNEVTDAQLFPEYGEFSVYWITSGADAGKFVYPNSLPDDYANLKNTEYTNYNWAVNQQVAIEFKREPNRIAIFKSQYEAEENTLSWEALYFERLFSEYLMGNVHYTINEEELAEQGLSTATQLLIIPAFTVKDEDYTFYIDSLFSVAPGFKNKLDAYLARGGKIIAEGNAAYFIEKLGYLNSGAIDYSSNANGEGFINLTIDNNTDLISLGASAANTQLNGSHYPAVQNNGISVVASSQSTGNPCIFRVNSDRTFGGEIICNTGLPTVYGLAEPDDESQQISWTMTEILSVFSHEIDVTRKVTNELIAVVPAGDNATSYDDLDTIVVDVVVRNLSNSAISNITVNENIKAYFTFLDVTSGQSFNRDGNELSFSGISLAAHAEMTITYRLVTPEPDNIIHESVDSYLDAGTLMAASQNNTSYTLNGFKKSYTKNKDYADILFSARIFADTDVNWKNFLGLYYQPFKVFMIMENKSRSSAENTEYVQYIPKDVPFYWVDHGLNIPILKTPGGKFIDILKGSNDENNPEFDMDSDGDPDVWLDTASIYPKGYTIVEEEVYWANPWNHLRTGDDSFVFEDIDHDGIIPTDTDGDGIVDANFDEDDKIRVYKVTWDIGQVAGYEYYDPYCSYELWVDPPEFIPFSAGIGYAHDSVPGEYPGMFYPYTEDINLADLSDTSWTNWMERNEDGSVMWKQLIHQKINNYEGFTFVDTSSYQLTPYDSLIGTAPQPRREFIAVLSLGGEEIDMRNYTPTQSLYSKVNYETVFGEQKVTPIRSTYTYWAPLPNPLQFEYLSNNYEIFDENGSTVKELPEYGNAHLVFDMDASTEYTYYWIRNVGYDVDYNDPSEVMDTVADLGDGVFGYFVYTIPKGMGGYRITLPTNADGSFNTDSIVKIDDLPFSKWIDNENSWNEVEVWESPFEYQIYIPQLLIPPALDDDNFDGIDDWIDDRGDRFSSKTGFLHDAFMKGDGEEYLAYPAVPIQDDIYGMVDSGWYAGADGEYGDDFFETLGKTHITIHADYIGRGREGTVEISKGGVLVCEEIFGGSPWVIFSHVLSGFASGTDISLESTVMPELVYYGIDTVYLKHVIADTNEPHSFDGNFSPYHISYGYGETTVTTYVGAKDPCSLISPAISMPALVDPDFDKTNITLVPYAAENPDNEDLASYPRAVEGTFIEVRIEVNNSTEDNWINTLVETQILPEIGEVEMSYVAYPRPLVPAQVDGDHVIPGDQPETFTTGWRFNQPESEVLVKMGDTLNLMQPTRRAYFVKLIRVNPSLEPGIYEIPFTLTGSSIHYDNTNNGTFTYEVPNALFSVVEKDANGNVSEYQKLVLNKAILGNLEVNLSGNFVPVEDPKWSVNDFAPEEFNSIETKLGSSNETIDLSQFSAFPSVDTNKLVIMQKGIVDSYNTDAEILVLSSGQTLNYSEPVLGDTSVTSEGLVVKPIGPRVKITNSVYSINGVLVEDTIVYESDVDLQVETLLTVKNTGTDISSNTIIKIEPGPYYIVLTDELDANCTYADGILSVDMGDIIPGEKKEQILPFLLDVDNIPEGVDIRTVIDFSTIEYEGTLVTVPFSFEDPEDVLLDIYDFEAIDISFTDLGNGTVEVTAEAHNRGITGSSVWFRIYPIIGGGAYEFPFAEIRREDFQPGETIVISGIYTLPVNDKSIEFIAIVDDAYEYVEVTEMNNNIKIDYLLVGTENPLALEKQLEIYPMPFTDDVNFKYSLEKEYQSIKLTVYDVNGKSVTTTQNCPSQQGINSFSWRNSNLPAGQYFYILSGVNTEGKSEEIFKGKIIKSRR